MWCVPCISLSVFWIISKLFFDTLYLPSVFSQLYSVYLSSVLTCKHYSCCVYTIKTMQVMYARQVDQRSAVFQKAIEVGDAYVLRTKVSPARAMQSSWTYCIYITINCLLTQVLLMRALLQKKNMVISVSDS